MPPLSSQSQTLTAAFRLLLRLENNTAKVKQPEGFPSKGMQQKIPLRNKTHPAQH
jgi:hypothetical protein